MQSRRRRLRPAERGSFSCRVWKEVGLMKDFYDVLVLGAGVVGCAIARELGCYDCSAAVLEREEDVCCGTSKANSAIIHAGFDAPAGSWKARLNVRGNAMMDVLADKLDIPFRRNGSLVLCFDEAELGQLHALYERGLANGVPDLRLLGREELHALEPEVSEEAVAALYAPTGGVVCPFAMTHALFENARANGVDFFFRAEARNIERTTDGWTVTTAAGEAYHTRLLINAAGLYGDVLHAAACGEKVSIVPRRGEYCLFDKRDGALVTRTIFQLPGRLGKGVLVTPTIHGNLLVGPTAEDILDREDKATTAEGLERALSTAERSVPALPRRDIITSFAGLRAHLAEGPDDFLLGERAPDYFAAIGIESPSLSSAPAIGELAARWAAEKLGTAQRMGFIATRCAIPNPQAMPFEERRAFLAQNPSYGSIVCRCEGISEGEIVEAIHRGARSLDGVKRRTRAGMGRCQGGFCTPRVMALLSRELGAAQTELTKGGGASFLLAGTTKEAEV